MGLSSRGVVKLLAILSRPIHTPGTVQGQISPRCPVPSRLCWLQLYYLLSFHLHRRLLCCVLICLIFFFMLNQVSFIIALRPPSIISQAFKNSGNFMHDLVLPAPSATSVGGLVAVFKLGDETPADVLIGNLVRQTPSIPAELLNHTSATALLDSKDVAPRLLRLTDTGDLFTRQVIDRDNVETVCGPLDCCQLAVCNLTFHVVFFFRLFNDAFSLLVHIYIYDANDNAPIFPNPSGYALLASADKPVDLNSNGDSFFEPNEPSITLWLPEDETAENGKGHSLPTAIDLDSQANSIIEYRLTGPSVNAGLFRLKQMQAKNADAIPTLVVGPNARLDYEKHEMRRFHLQLEAIDGGRPARVGRINIVVRVTDVNDNPPVFEHSAISIYLEEAKLYEEPVYRARAFDADSRENSKLRYILAAGFPDLDDVLLDKFRLNQHTGDLILRLPLDYERFQERRFVLPIVAADAGLPSLSATASLTINVVDVNDNIPELVVQQNFTVPENGPPGSLALRLEVRDADEVSRHKVTCNAPAQAELPLRLVKEAGESVLKVYVTATLDYEKTPYLTYQIVCVDNAEPVQTHTIHVTVSVGDLNDNSPFFCNSEGLITEAYNLTLREDELVNRVVLSAKAKDIDSQENARLTYRLYTSTPNNSSRVGKADSDPEYFHIGSNTGEVMLRQPLDYETKQRMDLIIEVHDNPTTGKALTATAKLAVSVLDVNDNQPELVSPSELRLRENQPAGTLVGHVKFIDHDSGPAGEVKIYPGWPQVRKSPKAAPYGRFNPENQYPLGLLEYHYNSVGRPEHSGHLAFSDSVASQFFELNLESGQLITLAQVDRESFAIIFLEVIAMDNGKPTQNSVTVTLTVSIVDENDNPPRLLKPHSGELLTLPAMRMHVSNEEIFDKKDQVLMRLQAYDEDQEENGRITYSLAETCNASDFLKVQPNNGHLLIKNIWKSKLDKSTNKTDLVHAVSTREVLVPDPGIYLICVHLKDNGLPSLSSEASFWLRIAQPASKEDLLHDSAEGGSSSDFSQPFIHLPNGRSSHLPEARFGSSEGLDASLTGVTGSDNSNATLRSGKRGMSAVFNSNTRLDDSSLITSKITGLSMARFSLGDTLSSAIVLVLVIVFCVALACALVAGGLWIRSRRLAVYRLRRHQQQYHQRHTEKDSSAKLQTTHNLNVNDGIITETGSIERAGRERKGEDWDNLNEQAELKFELNNSQKRNGSKMGVSTSQIYGLLTSTPFEADATQLEIDPLMRVNSFRNSASSFEKQNDLELTRDYCSIKTVTLPTSKTQPTVFLSTTASPPMASNSYVNASSISSTNRAHSKASELVCLQQLSTISGANQELLNTRDMSSLIGHTIQSSCSSGLSPASLVYVTLPKMAGSICPGIYAAYPEGLSTALSSSTLPATTPFSTPPPLSTGASCSKTSDLASLSTPISAIDFGLHGSTPIASPSSISEQKLSLYFDPSTGGNVSYLQDSSETDKTDQSNTNPLFNLQQPQCIPSTILMPKGLLDLHLIQAISTPEAQSPQMPSTTSLQSKFAVQRARNMDLNERDAGIDEDSSLLVANCLNSESQNFIAVSQVRNLPLI